MKNDVYFYSPEKYYGLCNTPGYYPGPIAPPCGDGAPVLRAHYRTWVYITVSGGIDKRLGIARIGWLSEIYFSCLV